MTEIIKIPKRYTDAKWKNTFALCTDRQTTIRCKQYCGVHSQRSKHIMLFVILLLRKFSPGLFKIGIKNNWLPLIFYNFTLAKYASVNCLHPGFNQWRWWEFVSLWQEGQHISPPVGVTVTTSEALSLIQWSHRTNELWWWLHTDHQISATLNTRTNSDTLPGHIYTLTIHVWAYRS